MVSWIKNHKRISSEILLFSILPILFLWMKILVSKEVVTIILQLTFVVFSIILASCTFVYKNLRDYLNSRIQSFLKIKDDEKKKSESGIILDFINNTYRMQISILILIIINLLITLTISFLIISWGSILQNFIILNLDLESILKSYALISFIIEIINILWFIINVINSSKTEISNLKKLFIAYPPIGFLDNEDEKNDEVKANIKDNF